jgi:hypothetical protein
MARWVAVPVSCQPENEKTKCPYERDTRLRGALSLMGVHLAKWTPSFSLMSASFSLKNQAFNERTPLIFRGN